MDDRRLQRELQDLVNQKGQLTEGGKLKLLMVDWGSPYRNSGKEDFLTDFTKRVRYGGFSKTLKSNEPFLLYAFSYHSIRAAIQVLEWEETIDGNTTFIEGSCLIVLPYRGLYATEKGSLVRKHFSYRTDFKYDTKRGVKWGLEKLDNLTGGLGSIKIGKFLRDDPFMNWDKNPLS